MSYRAADTPMCPPLNKPNEPNSFGYPSQTLSAVTSIRMRMPQTLPLKFFRILVH